MNEWPDEISEEARLARIRMSCNTVGSGRWYARHREAWEAIHGPVPSGMELDHLCRIKNCVNPDHLEPVSHQENLRRAYDRPTCRRGHRRNVNKWGRCTECQRNSDVRRNEKRRAKRAAVQ